MADQAAPTPSPASSVPKKPAKPTARFGQVLDLGGHQLWTVSSTDGGVIVSRRGYPDRRLTDEEFAAAKSHPLPTKEKNKGAEWAIRGIEMGRSFDLPDELGGTARIIGFDAISGGGEVQLLIPGRGPVWVPKSAVQDLRLATGNREKGLSTLREALGETAVVEEEERKKPKTPEEKAKRERIDRAVAKAEEEAAGTIVDRSVRRDLDILMGRDPEAAERARKEARRKAIEERERAPVVGTQPAAPVQATPAVEQPFEEPVEYETTTEVGGYREAAEPSLETAATVTPAPAGPATTTPAVSIAKTVAVGAGAAATTTPSVSVSKTVSVGAAPSAPSPAAAPSVQVSATVPVGGTPAANIRETRAMLKLQSDQARLSVEKMTPQEKLAVVARGQMGLSQPNPPVALKTSLTSLRELSPAEVTVGKIPTQIVRDIQRATPPATPQPTTTQVKAMVAVALAVPTPPAAEKPVAAVVATPTIRVGAPPVAARPTVRVGTPGKAGVQVAGGIRQQLRPEIASALAFHAPTPSAQAGDYVEGRGSSKAGMLPEGNENPVFGTKLKSYATVQEATEAEKEADIYEPGGSSGAGFMQRQREAVATGQQFLPESTGGLPVENLGPGEIERQTRVPTGAGQGPTPEERLRQQAMAAEFNKRRQVEALAGAVQEEEEESSEEKTKRSDSKKEDFQTAVSRLTDATAAALAVPTATTVIGAIFPISKLLTSLNLRVLAIKTKKGGIIQWFFPPAQYPYEVTLIAVADIFVLVMVFACLALLIGMFFVAYSLYASVPGLDTILDVAT